MTKRKGSAKPEAAPPKYSQHSHHEQPKPETRTSADTPAAGLPINVLIIGETQNGKSTMIRQMGVYAGLPELNIQIGFDTKNEVVEMRPFPELVALTDEDAVVVAAEPEENGKIHDFNFIDTPGLDDSSGNDMEIMSNIVGRIGELDHLNAVIYVRNMNKPFGASFKPLFEYLQRSMPTLCDGLIIVHSAFTIEKVEEFLLQRKDLAKLRKETFVTATKTDLELSHFFMDNDPDETSPFAVVQSFNECFRLLALLSIQRPLSTSGLRLLKTPSMSNVDVHVLYALEHLKNQLKDKWTSEVILVKESKANALKILREIQDLAIKIEECKSGLEEKDNNSDIVLGTKTLSIDYGICKTLLAKGQLWLERRPIQFEAGVRISHVHKSATGGSKWEEENLGEKSWNAVLTAGVFQNMNGSATFYTNNRIKHQGEIELLHKRIADLKKIKEFHVAALADMEVHGLRTSAVKLREEVEQCGRLIERVKMETFEINLWPLLRRFYVLHQAPTRDQVYEFVSVYEPEIAALL